MNELRSRANRNIQHRRGPDIAEDDLICSCVHRNHFWNLAKCPPMSTSGSSLCAEAAVSDKSKDEVEAKTAAEARNPGGTHEDGESDASIRSEVWESTECRNVE